MHVQNFFLVCDYTQKICMVVDILFSYLFILFLVCTLCEVLLRSGNGFGLGYLPINVESLLKLFLADEF